LGIQVTSILVIVRGSVYFLLYIDISFLIGYFDYFTRNIPGEIELRGNLEKIPRGPISNLQNSLRRSRGLFWRFEIGPRGIFKIPHECCRKYPEAQPRGIFDSTSGVSRKIARVAIPKDKPKYHEAQPSGIWVYPREWQRVQFCPNVTRNSEM